MLSFYLTAGGAALVTALLLVRPLIAGRSATPAQDQTDEQVYRDQLAELDRDLKRGTIDAAEAEGAKVEISRRLLAAVGRAKASEGLKPAPQGHSGLVAGLSLIGAPALAVLIYLGVGVPGLEDRPFAERQSLPAMLSELAGIPGRPTQAEAEASTGANVPQPESPADAEYRALVAQLEETVAQRPNDRNGHELLGNALMQLGRWSEAAAIYERAVELAGAQVDPELLGSRAESLILAAGGYVSADAEAALSAALAIDPSLAVARYYAGMSLRQAGRLDDAIRVWTALRRESPADAPYLQWLDMLLSETIQARGGTPPAGAPAGGPSQADINAANEMTPEARMEMIEGMVSRLEARLLRDGGAPQEWGQLIASYDTLGRPAEARKILDLALLAYPDGAANEALRTHALSLGLDRVEPPSAPAAPGPTRQDIEAAQEMSPEDRAAMIAGMVGRLEERLVTEGGSAEDWLRLITSYVRLERMEDANRVYNLAEAALIANDDPARGFVKEQALILGVDVE